MEPDERHADLRAGTRHKMVALAWYRLIESSHHPLPADETDRVSIREGVARSCDVSEEGLGLLTIHAMPVGCPLLIELTTKEGHITVVGEVAHCRPARPGRCRVGVKVLFVPPNDLSAFAALLS